MAFSPRPNLGLLFLLILILLLAFMAGNFMGVEAEGSERIFSTLLGLLGLVLILLVFMRLLSQPPPSPYQRVLTVLKCEKCDVRNIREFRRGDYIPKREGKCPNCDGEMFIEAISPEEPPRKKKKRSF